MGEQPALPGERRAGAFLLRSGPFLGLAVLAVALPAAVLVPAGLWRPAVTLPVVAVGLALAWRLTGLVPVRPVPVLSAGLSGGIALVFGLWAAATHAENMVLRRDPGSYALFAQWIGTRHGLPVDTHLDAFGGAAVLDVPGFTLASPAYYQVVHGSGVEIVPQFLLGGPALFSLGWWAAGWTGMFLVGPLLGAFAVLGVAGLAARLVGPRWAPAAAGVLALTFPVLHSARSTYSETPALVVVFAAAALAVEALRADGAVRARALGATGGAVLGLAGLIRVDSLVEVALLVPVGAVLALRRHPAAAPLTVGAVAGAGVAAVPAVTLSRPYLETISGSLLPLVAGTAALLVASASVVAVARGRERRRSRREAGTGEAGTGEAGTGEAGTGEAGTGEAGTGETGTAGAVTDAAAPRPGGGGPVGGAAPEGGNDAAPEGGNDAATEGGIGNDAAPEGGNGAVSWWPDARWRPLGPWGRAGAAAMLLLGLLLVARPLFLTARQDPADPGAIYVASMQAAQDLVVDGGRTYAEYTLVWVSWWLGPLAVGAAWVTFAVLAGRALVWWRSGRRRAPDWLVPAAVGIGSSLLTLLRPGITPDHPWADRRLVVVLLPTFVLGAVALVAWCVRWARHRLPASLLTATTVAVMTGLFVPPAVGVGPFAVQRTEVGEPDAVWQVCEALRPGDVVLAVDARGANEWPQVVRGVCGVPAAALSPSMTATADAWDRTASVVAVGQLVSARGGNLVLLAADSGQAGPNALSSIGQRPRQVVSLLSWEDQRTLERAPWRSSRLVVGVWFADWTPPASG